MRKTMGAVSLVVCLAGCDEGSAAPPRGDGGSDGSGGEGACVPAERDCDGDDVLACTESREWTLSETCATACEDGACVLPVCSAGALRCNGDDVERCDARGLEWEFRQVCSTACHEGLCDAAVCSPYSRRCSGLEVEECNATGTAWVAQDVCTVACSGNACTTSGTCTEGATRCSSRVRERCEDGAWTFMELCPVACLAGTCRECLPGDVRCSGDVAESCEADGGDWTAEESCSAGCIAGACTTCRPGARRCSGASVEACAADGSGYFPVGECMTSCVGGECTLPICVPLAARCNGDTIEMCSASGAEWTAVDRCDDGCTDCACGGGGGGDVCAPGTRRCVESDVELCNVSGSEWFYEQTCLGVCEAGVCAAGPACRPFEVEPAVDTVRPGSGSSVLVATSTIADVAGTPVPDGTLVVVETTEGSFATGTDADPDTSEVEVRTFRGRADVALLAPTAAGEGLVWLYVRGAEACGGASSVRFALDGGSTPRSAGVDFTTTAARDGAATTAFWDTALGRVTAGPSTYGIGQDGDLIVSSGLPFNLTTTVRSGQTFSDAPHYSVGAMGTDYVIVDRLPAALTPGDEVLLVNLQSGSGSREGTYELLTVARTEALRVYFATNVQKTYGASDNGNITGQRVMLQRVPRYQTVSVGGTLTADAWDGVYGGVLFIKAADTISVTGTIDMSGRGYRGATTSFYQGESFERIGIASYGANNGGGGGGQDTTGWGTYYDRCYHWMSNYGGGCSGTWFLGGGGGYAGQGGTTSRYNQQGSYAYGNGGNGGSDDVPTRLHLGSAGGVGYQSVCTPGASCTSSDSPAPVRTHVPGGNGGGLIVLYAPTITIAGQVLASGSVVTSGGYSGTSGSGGTIYIVAGNVALGSGVRATGATPAGAQGADGRIRVDATTRTGSTTPSYVAGSSPDPGSSAVRLQTIPLNGTATNITSATIVRAERYVPGTSRLRFFLSNDNANYTEVGIGTLHTFLGDGQDLTVRVDWEASGTTGVPSLSGFTVTYGDGP